MYNKFSYFLLAALFLFGCKKDETTEAVVSTVIPKVNIHVSNEVDGTPIIPGNGNYTNANGELYTVNLLKYYIGHITLIDENGNEVALNDHDLIDVADPTSLIIAKTNVPNAHYVSLRFNLGIEESHNHTGDQEGELDPIFGMIWTWDTGYIFFKHEGSFINSMGDNGPIVYHYGTDEAFVTVEKPISFHGSGNEVNLDLHFNLNALYADPNMVVFEGNNAHQSSGAGDIPWINDLKENFTQAFSVDVQ
ncbi:MAG: MbnP family protein [Flavobacteriales bacterium]|nr:MbnP family protein [Flavobacteriales bacterium]